MQVRYDVNSGRVIEVLNDVFGTFTGGSGGEPYIAEDFLVRHMRVPSEERSWVDPERNDEWQVEEPGHFSVGRDVLNEALATYNAAVPDDEKLFRVIDGKITVWNVPLGNVLDV